MRVVFALIALLALNGAAAAGSSQAALQQRCVAAITASGEPGDLKSMKATTIPLGDSGFLFQYTDKNGGAFSCQVCDDANPAVHACGSIGLELSFRPKDGEMKRLPAELDKKCSYFLQKELQPVAQRMTIDHAMVQRIKLAPEHTDSRWVYRMQLDGNDYRCVVRKNDGSFRVEAQHGSDWKVLANGVLF
jgi:hypothetical protein